MLIQIIINVQDYHIRFQKIECNGSVVKGRYQKKQIYWSQ